MDDREGQIRGRMGIPLPVVGQRLMQGVAIFPLLASLSESQITTPNLPANLSVKDVVAHLWAWQQLSIARLEAGNSIMKPRIILSAGDQLNGPDRESVQLRLERWIQRHIAGLLEPLIKLEEDEEITGLARGFSFRLVENLGVLPRDEVAEDVKSLSQDERAKLRKHGVRFGAFHVFVPALLKPAPTALRLLLWALWLEKQGQFDRTKLPEPPGQGLTSVPFDRSTPRGFYRVIGFRICGPRSVRIDMLERLGDLIRERVFWKSRFEGEARPSAAKVTY
jgi:ATP-dependent RNA helicase SUPV3L1/SUV3